MREEALCIYILSDFSRDISQKIWDDMKQGATILEAKGGYTGEHKDMLMTITNNLQLKRFGRQGVRHRS